MKVELQWFEVLSEPGLPGKCRRSEILTGLAF